MKGTSNDATDDCDKDTWWVGKDHDGDSCDYYSDDADDDTDASNKDDNDEYMLDIVIYRWLDHMDECMRWLYGCGLLHHRQLVSFSVNCHVCPSHCDFIIRWVIGTMKYFLIIIEAAVFWRQQQLPYYRYTLIHSYTHRCRHTQTHK